MPSSGWSCPNPAKAPAPLKTPTASNVSVHRGGDTGRLPSAACHPLTHAVTCLPSFFPFLVVRLPLQDLR